MRSSQKNIPCEHCGTAFIPKADERYCCNGCYYVAQLIQQKDLDRFYDLKGDSAIPPIGSKVLQTEGMEHLETAFAEAEAATDSVSLLIRLSIEGISCIGCVWLIETLYKRQPGAGDISINAQKGALEISWQRGAFDLIAFARELWSVGYRIHSDADERPDDAKGSSQLTHRIGLCGFFLLNTMLFTLPPASGAWAFWSALYYVLLGASLLS